MDRKDIKSMGKVRKSLVNFLNRIPIFDKLEDDELGLVIRFMGFKKLEKGGILFKEGEEGNFVFFVVDGCLDVMKKSISGGKVAIATLVKGKSVGEMSVIDSFPRSATVKARIESSLIIMTIKGFNLILEQHPKIGIKILKGISRLISLNLRKTSSRLADYMLPLE